MTIEGTASENGYHVVTLSDAPIKSVAEIRWQNTLSGASTIDVTEVDADGKAALGEMFSFGQHIVPTIRILNDKNSIELVTFVHKQTESGHVLFVDTKTDQSPVNITTPKAMRG